MCPVSLTLHGISGKIAALSYGDSGNPPILSLHGWLDNAASFGPLSAYLTDYHLIALDFAGHGLSDHRPSGVKYHLIDYVADVAHAVSSLELERFHLAGHSLGAGVAILYAAAYPDAVEKLILIDGVGPLTESPDKAIDRVRKSIDAGLVHSKEFKSNSKLYKSWQHLVEARVKASPISRDSAELLVRRSAKEQSAGIKLRSDRRLRHPSPFYFTEETVMHYINRVVCPTLAILATEGVVAHRTQTRSRLSAFNNVEVSECKGQHHVHMDQPEQVARVINKFLKQN